MIKLGIVGVGTIGGELSRICVRRLKDQVQLVGIYDTDKNRERALRKELSLRRSFTLDSLIRSCDLIVEAASAKAAFGIAKKTLSQGKDMMIMSAGGIVHKEKTIYRIAREHRSCVYLPSGAVTGLDGLKSAHVGQIRRVSLITRKSPVGYTDAPLILKKRIRLESIKKETLLFDGSAEKAIEGFPQNTNISVTLSLAGIGARRTRVKIYASPGLTRHIHEVYVEGDFGMFYTRTENLPAANNPKTSRMAILSAVATLKRILDYIKIGT